MKREFDMWKERYDEKCNFIEAKLCQQRSQSGGYFVRVLPFLFVINQIRTREVLSCVSEF